MYTPHSGLPRRCAWAVMVALLSPLALAADSDGDSIEDDMDNCIVHANADQRDSSGDGFGNACDTDLDDNCLIDLIDLDLLNTFLDGAPGAVNWNPDADFDGDDLVSDADTDILNAALFTEPGPSAAATCP